MSKTTLANLNFYKNFLKFTLYDDEENDMFKYKDSTITLIGKGGYGSVYKINDHLVVKYIKYDGTSERLQWKAEHEKIDITPEMEKKAFLDDVIYEAEIQNEVHRTIRVIDDTPITPRVINAYVLSTPVFHKNERHDKQYAFIFMEYCEGISFDSVLKNLIKVDPVSKIITSNTIIATLEYTSIDNYHNIKKQIESILDQLHHNLHIVHGDLLGDNLIVQFDQNNQNPIVKIIDFGQACPLELYPYYYDKKERKKMRPDESTYDVIDLIDRAVLLLEKKSYRFGKTKKSVRKTKKSVRKTKKSVRKTKKSIRKTKKSIRKV